MHETETDLLRQAAENEPEPIRRWIIDNMDQGHYAQFAGMWREVSSHDALCEVEEKLDIYEQAHLYGLIVDWIREAARIGNEGDK